MAFYFIIFAFLCFFSFVEIFGLKKVEILFIFCILSFGLFTLSFLRWETGTDWKSYIDIFSRSTDFFIENEYEWGFARINEFVRIIFDNYTVLLFVLGTILFSFQSSAILKFSPYPITSLFVLWSVSFGNVFFIRQTIATVILLYSVRYIQENKFWKFLLLLATAMMFHRTSIIFILAWWIYRLKLRPITLFFYIVSSVFLSVIIGKIMENLGGVIGGVVGSKIEFYLSDSENTFGSETSLAQIIVKGFANKIFIFLLSLFMLKKIEKQEPDFRGFLNLYWAGIIIYFSTISISVALIRLSFSYDIVLIIIIPFILKYSVPYYMRFLIFLMFVLYLLARLYIAITSNYFDLYVPFKTIFD